MSHNKSLKILLNSVESKVSAAHSIDELIDSVEQVAAFNGSVEFDNSVPNMILGICLSLILPIGTIAFLDAGRTDPTAYVVMGVLAVIGLISLIFRSSRKSVISGISDEIFRKKILFDNDLAEKPVNAKEYAKTLKSYFKEFDRGNHSREIMRSVTGNYAGDIHNFSYEHYHFKYVDRRTETTTVSDGKGGTRTQHRTVYDTYHRYGVIFDIGTIANLAILGYGASIKGIEYRPASINFNKLFKVKAGSQLSAAKFLKPTVVLLIEGLSTSFSKLNFEINSDSMLCLSFRDDDLLKSDRKFGINEPGNFMKEIKENRPIPKLHTLLTFLHDLMRLTDKNFEVKTYGE